MVFAMRGVFLAVAVVFSVAEGAEAAIRSPLDLSATVLTRSLAFLPKGVKRWTDCDPEPKADCAYAAPGIVYGVLGGRILEIEMTRVNGRFLQPLPYGLTGGEDRTGVEKALRQRRIALAPVVDQPNVLASDLIRVRKQMCWVEFEFGKDGRIEKAAVKMRNIQTD
jgi:hypothetical protein